MRCRSGRTMVSTSAAVNRGVMNSGQFQSKASTWIRNRAAAVLDVGGPGFGDAGQIEAVAGADEGPLPRPEAVGLRGIRHRIGLLPIGRLLGLPHSGGEVTMEVVLSHGWSSVQAWRPFIGR